MAGVGFTQNSILGITLIITSIDLIVILKFLISPIYTNDIVWFIEPGFDSKEDLECFGI